MTIEPLEIIENLDITNPPVEKVLPEKAVRVGNSLGGPWVAGYLMAEACIVFNETAKAKKPGSSLL